MSQDQMIKKQAIDWRWLLVSFCFFVLFHLFPSSLASGLKLFFSSRLWDSFFLWGVGGIAVISGYIGYRSRGKAVPEPVIAALLYVVLLRLIVTRTGSSTEYFGRIPAWLAILPIVFGIASAAALLGGWLYRRQVAKRTGELNRP